MLTRVMLAQVCVASALIVQPRLSDVLRRAPAPCMVDIPRITLPDTVSSTLKDLDLKNPNELTQEEYNSYSGAAIGGTLIIFLLPGSLIFDVKGFFFDFIFAALIGGGLCAYLSLRKDQAAELANEHPTGNPLRSLQCLSQVRQNS